eukprot:TRINITY_DN2819_c0_g1_i1.p1 TRINITY_DN2819_c0_g1~~TRINITY_DN2819_c0_g1_i1.p1  ORF type:complete len:234 (+),score=30.08 TRINITY_DN2819_c0_g1_i1:138-839(+)
MFKAVVVLVFLLFTLTKAQDSCDTVTKTVHRCGNKVFSDKMYCVELDKEDVSVSSPCRDFRDEEGPVYVCNPYQPEQGVKLSIRFTHTAGTWKNANENAEASAASCPGGDSTFNTACCTPEFYFPCYQDAECYCPTRCDGPEDVEELEREYYESIHKCFSGCTSCEGSFKTESYCTANGADFNFAPKGSTECCDEIEKNKNFLASDSVGSGNSDGDGDGSDGSAACSLSPSFL